MNLELALEAVKDLPHGDYAEIGVWQGNGARYIVEGMNPSAWLWLFDTFTGHPDEPGEFDLAEYHPKGRYADTSLAAVEKRFADHGHILYIPGHIPETFDYVSIQKFRFVRIDIDHYAPTKASIEFFLPRMVAGGIIEFDDWEHPECPGATRAIREVLGDEAAPCWQKPKAFSA